MNWNEYFSELAIVVSKKSKDKCTQVGSVIVGPDHEIRSTGYNSFPVGILDDISWRQEKPQKYEFFEHSERNAIYLAARVGTPLKGCTIYTHWLPCTGCTRAIIQSGIVKVVINEDFREEWESKEKWNKLSKYSLQMLAEAKIQLLSWSRKNGTTFNYI